ncbi:unnamed protein product [Ceutorhynchus assimilis]|uniref:Uncharacterized protein n=1 Tax=Ceutorhynchus assimilis TaxID=467358 RepID=A0A9N9QIS1_9CUCU|nr:unnamed protein product [Ceutorhynchus assimilis]
MECHIEQVLNRDQRTIKTRMFNRDSATHQNNKNRNFTEDSKFLQYNCQQTTDLAPSKKSSLSFCNCHDQYFSNFKRLLYQTEVMCGWKEVNDIKEVKCEKMKKDKCKSWLKKFHHVLLLSTYLSLITFPYSSAVPTTISSRATTWNSKNSQTEPKGHEMNTTALTHAFRSAKSARDIAMDLKRKFKEKASTDLDQVFQHVPAYDWLPNVPKVSSDVFGTHLNSLELSQIVVDLYNHIDIMKQPVNQLALDFANDGDAVWAKNFSGMWGQLENINEELKITIAENSLTFPQDVGSDIMPQNLKDLNKTDKAVRDWIIIRTLVEVLEYTVAVFEHFQIPY